MTPTDAFVEILSRVENRVFSSPTDSLITLHESTELDFHVPQKTHVTKGQR